MSIKKTIYLITMTLILCIMTLGYAALQERIDVEVEANIDSTYRVEITRVQEGTSVGEARSVSAPSYHDLTSTFNVGLTNDTDYITYTIEVTNYSTVDVILNNTEITTTNNNIKVTKYGIRNGDIMLAGSTKTVTIRIKLTDTTTDEQTGAVTVIFDFTRLKGGVGQVVSDLPSGYQECEYLESTGTQYIDTKYIINENFKYVLKTAITDTSTSTGIWPVLMGAYGSSDASDGKYYTIGYKPSTKIIFGVEYELYEIFNLEWKLGETIINNTVKTNTKTWAGATTSSVCLFNVRTTNMGVSSSFRAIARIYHAQIYDGDTLVRDMIPCYSTTSVVDAEGNARSSGTIGFYDTVEGKFYTNKGTGTFLKGPDI